MEENKKMKVAMICHFSNAEVRSHLPLEGGNRFFYHLVRKALGLAGKKGDYGDIAPWDTNIIKAIEERDDIDLYVLSTHSGLQKAVVPFDIRKVHYRFFRCEFGNMLKTLIPSDELWRKLNPMAIRIKRAVYDIKPDLVLLVGAENAHYASSVLKIDNYPIYLLCQTVYNNPEFKASGTFSKKNSTTELEILKKVRYAAVYSKKHYDCLRKLGYDKYIFSFNWPVVRTNPFHPAPVKEKKYDFINFALQMSREKGYHDCVEALAIVKKKYPHVQLNLVDHGSDDVRQELKKMIKDYGLEDNVTFTPFFAERKDLFQHLQNSRYAVLPCKVDHISGTQLQSMQYGLPVVCYRTTGTPTLNKDKECVLIAELNDVNDLACKMLLLMDNPELAETLRVNSFEATKARIAQSLNNMNRLAENFRSIISNYQAGTPIPQEQLFNPEVEE